MGKSAAESGDEVGEGFKRSDELVKKTTGDLNVCHLVKPRILQMPERCTRISLEIKKTKFTVFDFYDGTLIGYFKSEKSKEFIEKAAEA